MPHLRDRHCLPNVLKKLTFSPVVTIQGARQTGKSVLVQQVLPKELPGLQFVTFDESTTRDFAESNPDSFLAGFNSKDLVAIDEAQKVPRIFDAVKLSVDRNRRPGRYILLGSTEFSKQTLIRESLTGRVSRARVFPFTLAETHQLPIGNIQSPILASEKPRVSRGDLIQSLVRGGLPAILFVRNESTRNELLRDWIKVSLERDLMHIPKIKLDPAQAHKILVQVAVLPEPTAANIASALRMSARRIHTYLWALKTLFILEELRPHPEGTGKPLFFLFDVGIAKQLGASFPRLLQTRVLLEVLARLEYSSIRDREISFYRGSKGGIIDLVLQKQSEIVALKVLGSERFDKREIMGLLAWKNKNPSVGLFALGASRLSLKKEKIEVYPWESIG